MEPDEYRVRDGKIEVRFSPTRWMPSSHDDATADEVDDYEKDGHPAAAALREKFGRPA